MCQINKPIKQDNVYERMPEYICTLHTDRCQAGESHYCTGVLGTEPTKVLLTFDPLSSSCPGQFCGVATRCLADVSLCMGSSDALSYGNTEVMGYRAETEGQR